MKETVLLGSNRCSGIANLKYNYKLVLNFANDVSVSYYFLN